jgi:acetyl-CoA acetyltransferase
MDLDDVAVASVGETEKRRPKTVEAYRSLEELYAEATRLTLDGTGLTKDDVDGLGVINAAVETPPIYAGRLAETLGFEDLAWTVGVDTGGSSALSLLAQGALAVRAGAAEAFLCLGADAPVDPRKADGELFPRDPSGYVKNFVDPFGTQGPNSRLAHVQRVHMDEHGTTREQLAAVSVVQRRHAGLNPLAYLQEPVSVEDYLDCDPIADPVGLLDCVIPVDAGFGVLLVSAERAAELPVEPVHVSGFGECTNHGTGPKPDVTTTGVAAAGPGALASAGVDPDEVDFVQLYDDYPIVVAMQLEDLGYCEKGEAGPLLASTDLGYDGELPLNTGGGQLSVGQSGMAAGFVQLCEGVRQLQGDGGDRQVPDATRGVVTGVGGVAYGKNLRHASVAVLESGVAR